MINEPQIHIYITQYYFKVTINSSSPNTSAVPLSSVTYTLSLGSLIL